MWAWEKYYKEESPATNTQSVSLQKIDLQLLPTQSSPPDQQLSEEEDSEPGIFSRKELLTPGETVLEVVGNRSERQLLARMGGSVAVGLRVENWSRHELTRPAVLPASASREDFSEGSPLLYFQDDDEDADNRA